MRTYFLNEYSLSYSLSTRVVNYCDSPALVEQKLCSYFASLATSIGLASSHNLYGMIHSFTDIVSMPAMLSVSTCAVSHVGTTNNQESVDSGSVVVDSNPHATLAGFPVNATHAT